MAAADIAARRYADALFAVARERGQVAAEGKALDAAASVLGAEDAARVLGNPRVTLADKERFALSALGDVTPAVRNLVRLLLRRGRTGILADIAPAYQELADRLSGVVRADVTVAVEVDEEQRRRIARALSERLGGRVETIVRRDPGILGGLVIRIGDRVIDSSIRTRLSQLQAELS